MAAYTKSSIVKNIHTQLAKAAILLVVSLGLLWFSEEFSPVRIFESHTCPGGRCQGSLGWVLWVSFAKDLIQPFALYFFICLGDRWLKTWQWRALLAFAIPTIIEFGQHLHIRLLTGHYGGSFDPLDILMYAIGIGLAVIVEQLILAKLLKFWSNNASHTK